MEPIPFALFLAIAAVASYVQTVTGFAFGLIMVGTVTGLNLAPIEFTAVVVSFCALTSALIALKGAHQGIQFSLSGATLLGLFPAMLAGVLLLEYLSQEAASQLKLILGLTILAGGIFLMLKPAPYSKPSASYSYTLAGIVGGFFGGLFSVSGPPIVYHIYRQPVALQQIKMTLLVIFGSASLIRICIVGIQGDLEHQILFTSALAAPLVVAASLLGKYFPPPLSDRAMRRGAFLLLSMMGTTLVLIS